MIDASLLFATSRYEFLLNVPPDTPVSGQVDTSPLAITSHYAVGTVVGSAKGLFGKDLTAEQEVWVFAGAEEEGQSFSDLPSTST